MSTHKLVVCLSNRGYEVSLEPRKLYEVMADPRAEKQGQIRVVDESGEGYLYPKSLFASAALPNALVERLLQAA